MIAVFKWRALTRPQSPMEASATTLQVRSPEPPGALGGGGRPVRSVSRLPPALAPLRPRHPGQSSFQSYLFGSSQPAVYLLHLSASPRRVRLHHQPRAGSLARCGRFRVPQVVRIPSRAIPRLPSGIDHLTCRSGPGSSFVRQGGAGLSASARARPAGLCRFPSSDASGGFQPASRRPHARPQLPGVFSCKFPWSGVFRAP